jgi:hypothetical protein
MVVVVPNGNDDDPTRKPSFYEGIWEYLNEIGIEVIN